MANVREKHILPLFQMITAKIKASRVIVHLPGGHPKQRPSYAPFANNDISGSLIFLDACGRHRRRQKKLQQLRCENYKPSQTSTV
jgi:hypothetical protein